MNVSATRYLAPCVILCVVLVLGGATLFVLADRLLQRTRAEQLQATATVRSLRDKYTHTEQDEPAIRQAIARFDQLRQRGVIGAERRLEWADTLQRIRTVRRLPLLEYEILPQRVLRPLGEQGEYTLTASPMRLHLGLLHEGDLLRVLGDLRQHYEGQVVIRDCTMTRAPTTATGAGDTISLVADCTLDWLTIQKTAPAPALVGTTR
ncbi:MAG: hypothetical protein QM639_04690 [Rhodocyclaceae bacterium]